MRKQSHPSRFCGVGHVRGHCPLGRGGKGARLASRGIWEASALRVTELGALRCVEPVPCESPIRVPCESPIRVPCESPSPVLYDVSSQYPASHRAQPNRGVSIRRAYCTQLHSLEWPPQALIYSLTVYPSSASPASAPPSTSPIVLFLARYPPRFTPLRLYPPLSSSVASEAYIHPYAFVS